VSEASSFQIQQRLRHSFALDRLWRETMGLPMGGTKEQPLRAAMSVLEASGTSYAVIGGVAMQLHSREPRTTLDIDLAVPRYDLIPRDALIKAGFSHERRHEHSDDWCAPAVGTRAERTAIHFSSDNVRIDSAVAQARVVDAGEYQFRLATPSDLLVLKLAAAEEVRRRGSKRREDLLDIITLCEEHPDAVGAVPHLRQRVERLSRQLFALDRNLRRGR